MTIAVLLRYMDMKKGPDYFWNERQYILHDYKIMADKYKIGMCAVMSEHDLDKICGICDGLIIPGSGANVNPKYWGGPDVPSPGPDEYALDSQVIKKFYEAGKPMFGICGGHQSLNVFFGGSLRKVADLNNHYDKETSTHPVNIVKGSFVYDVFGTERTVINSHHGMCIEKLAPDLSCVATADDGENEAVEWKEKNVFATQWHPEQTLHGRGDPIEHKFFENFFKRCEECR